MEGRPRRNMQVVIGDFIAKIGSNNAGYEGIMGKEGLGEMNENDERFANFFDTFDLVIGGSIYKNKCILKVTWRHPNQTTENRSITLHTPGSSEDVLKM